MAKTTEVKKEAVKAAEKAVAAPKTEEKAAPAAKKATKAPAAKKPAAKKAPAKKPAGEKAEAVYVQFGGQEWNVTELKAQAAAAFVAEGHRQSSIKTLDLYVKPEEGKAFYVINEKNSGSIDL